MKQQLKLSLLALFAISFVTACNDSDDDKKEETQQEQVQQEQQEQQEEVVEKKPVKAFVQTVAPDYTSSEVVHVSYDDKQVTSGYFIKDASDYSLVSYKDAVYHLGRYSLDTIDKYMTETTDAAVWSYSTQDSEDSTSRNLYTMAFANEEKAYVVRYGSPKVWIVNPQATQAENFKMGELDLSAYGSEHSESTPRAADAIVTDGKLYIVMQRLDDSWVANTAYVAVFDTTTDAEIETNASSDDEVMGIPLAGKNPRENSLFVFENEVFVSSYSQGNLDNSKIEAINTNDFSKRNVITASDIADNTTGQIQHTVVESATKGYFVATRVVQSYPDPYMEASTLYQFNPTTGEITTANVANTGEEDINFISYDSEGRLWMSVGSDSTPGIDVLDTSSNELSTERLLTELTPSAISFIQD